MLIKRLTAMFLMVACLQVNAKTIAQIITLSEQNAPLDKVFKKIEKQSGYSFVYRDQLLKQARKVTIEAKGATLEKVLDMCFRDQPLTYAIVDKTIVVSERGNRDAQFASTVSPSVVVKGRVTDAKGKPLEGVSVAVSGGLKGTSTNADGNFTLNVDSKDAVLVFTYIGMQTQRIPVGNSVVINVTLLEADSQLEEMIVTGYGIKENKANQVGSAVRVGAEDLQRKPADRIDRLLEGLVPGLQFQLQDNGTSSARPRFETRIRGEGSVRAAGDPLWIVDGVPLYVGTETNLIPNMQTSISPLTYLNPDDIESISVLKDATATTIYGANGANGVVYITTKKGAVGKDRVSYNFRTGFNYVTDTKFQVLNGDEYRELVREAALNTGKPYPFIEARDTVNTDWYDLFFRRGSTTQHNLSFSGGNAKTKYFISGAYYKEKMTMIANQTDRLSFRMNLDQQVNKRLSLTFRLGGSYNSNQLFSPGNDFYTNRPNINPYNPDGSFALYDSVVKPTSPDKVPKFFNVLAEAYQNDNNQSTYAMNGTIGGTLQIIEGLTFTTTNGIDFYNMREDKYSSMKNWSGRDLSGNLVGYAYRYQNSYIKWISINRLNFSREFGVHAVDLMAGTEASADKRNSVSASGFGFANDYIREITSVPDENQRASSSMEETSSLSMLARSSYTYDRRYSITGNYRRDGNSRFGKDVRWAKFFSAGAAWNISNESFWRSKVIDFAKIKLSYGTNGNSRIGNRAKGLYDFRDDFSYNGKPGAVLTQGENQVFSWEKTYMFNSGVDLSFYNRIALGVEVYQNTTKNLIDDVEVSRTSGQRRIYRNLGEIRNRGIEISLSTTNIKAKHFEWQTRFNVSRNRNKVMKLYNNLDQISGTEIRRVGEDVKSLYLVRWAGVDPIDGMPRWYDSKGNITRVLNQTQDRVIIGSGTPDFYGGISNNITYRNFTLSALINFTVGGYQFSSLRRDAEDDGLNIASINQSRNILDRWQNSGDLALSPVLLLGQSTSSSLNSSRYLHKKTNIRLNNVSLNYAVPAKIASKLRMGNLSAYLQADNLGFWTPYGNKKNRNTYKNSFSPYPLQRVVSLGIVAGI